MTRSTSPCSFPAVLRLLASLSPVRLIASHPSSDSLRAHVFSLLSWRNSRRSDRRLGGCQPCSGWLASRGYSSGKTFRPSQARPSSPCLHLQDLVDSSGNSILSGSGDSMASSIEKYNFVSGSIQSNGLRTQVAARRTTTVIFCPPTPMLRELSSCQSRSHRVRYRLPKLTVLLV